MSDRVHRTVRPTLPEGYQYGDMTRAVQRHDEAERDWYATMTPWPPCGHQSQIASQYTLVTLPDGTTTQERIPQKFRPRVGDARFCAGCGQLVDDIDDVEARTDHGWRAPHENAAEQLKRRGDGA